MEAMVRGEGEKSWGIPYYRYMRGSPSSMNSVMGLVEAGRAPISLEHKKTQDTEKVLTNRLMDMLQVKGLQGSGRSRENP